MRTCGQKNLFSSENDSTFYVKTSCNPGGNEKFQFSSPTCESWHLLRVRRRVGKFSAIFHHLWESFSMLPSDALRVSREETKLEFCLCSQVEAVMFSIESFLVSSSSWFIETRVVVARDFKIHLRSAICMRNYSRVPKLKLREIKDDDRSFFSSAIEVIRKITLHQFSAPTCSL